MQTRSYNQRIISTAAEYPIMITRAEAEAGTKHVVRFHGPDGRERCFTIAIPPGVTTGARVPVEFPEGAGDAGLGFGDLVAVITVLPHISSECRGADVYVTVQIDRATAEREGEVRVPLGDGRVLAVPIRPGMTRERLVYTGQGLPRGYAPLRRGDLILRLELIDLARPDAAAITQRLEPPRRWWRSLLRIA
jgi:curved DNA-binding protein